MRKILIMLLICISPVIFLTGCDSEISFDNEYDFTIIKEISEPSPSKFENGYQRLYLISDNQTHIIYYCSPTTNHKGRNMCPYYSKNGKLCKFIDSEIVEIE